MQLLWAKVLAGEANTAGAYSKRTVNFLGSLDQVDAQLFTSLCGFAWNIGGPQPLIYDLDSSIYKSQKITFSSLTHLDDIGLVSFDSLAGFEKIHLPKTISISYHETPLMLQFKKATENELEIGNVLLTKIGKQLAPICVAGPVDGFFNYIFKIFENKGLAPASPNLTPP